MGIEPTTLGLLDPRSNQLSYEGYLKNRKITHIHDTHKYTIHTQESYYHLHKHNPHSPFKTLISIIHIQNILMFLNLTFNFNNLIFWNTLQNHRSSQEWRPNILFYITFLTEFSVHLFFYLYETSVSFIIFHILNLG